ncbi:hypothetical protein Sjap_008544 [Stephania japonica]|uniref:Uncharacterized protein n=1 Tax=Stephania japonica TaxID=461633 RepID=A0AAP0PEQ4_9MAGN
MDRRRPRNGWIAHRSGLTFGRCCGGVDDQRPIRGPTWSYTEPRRSKSPNMRRCCGGVLFVYVCTMVLSMVCSTEGVLCCNGGGRRRRSEESTPHFFVISVDLPERSKGKNPVYETFCEDLRLDSSTLA